jgi:hypothetical protein
MQFSVADLAAREKPQKCDGYERLWLIIKHRDSPGPPG